MGYNIIFSDELYHHGVKGQKWGVRRYQNPDGSLTALGKQRLYDKESSQKMLNNIERNKRFKPSSNGLTAQHDYINDAASFIKNQGKVAAEEATTMSKALDKCYKDLKTDKKFIDAATNELVKRLGPGRAFAGDDERPWDEASNIINEWVEAKDAKWATKEYKEAAAKFDKDAKTYFDNIEALAKDLAQAEPEKIIGQRKGGLFKAAWPGVKYETVVMQSIKDMDAGSGSQIWKHYNRNKQEGYFGEDGYGEGWPSREELQLKIYMNYAVRK